MIVGSELVHNWQAWQFVWNYALHWFSEYAYFLIHAQLSLIIPSGQSCFNISDIIMTLWFSSSAFVFLAKIFCGCLKCQNWSKWDSSFMIHSDNSYLRSSAHLKAPTCLSVCLFAVYCANQWCSCIVCVCLIVHADRLICFNNRNCLGFKLQVLWISESLLYENPGRT